MSWLNNRAVRASAVVAIAALGLGACASTEMEERMTAMDGRIGQLEAQVQSAAQSAASANSAAQGANSAAQGAATAARTNGQRIDQLEGRVNAMEQAPARTPRG